MGLGIHDPSALNFGSGGVGTGPHLQGELLKIRTGIDMKHVAYRGAAAAQQDILGGSIQLMFTAAPTALSFINGGELKVLASTGAVRLPILPAVPTMIEAGIKDYVSEQWFGLLAPAKTPEPILQLLYELATMAITDPAVAKRMTEQGGYLRPGSSKDFSRFMQAEVQSWGEIVRLAKLAAE